ncbi:FtsX-like permease family protein [Shewanella sp. Scap07]|uniref:ABC transporter permease n=1 Tax=Shewanella sp. Scap07 TaxID=2589987 RepID=UPI002118E481|nr:FtsX-like permease family protein [Shewanella sp. Scap07]
MVSARVEGHSRTSRLLLIIKLAWRNLWRNRLRTGIMLACMVFGLMGVVTMMGFMTGMYANMIDNAISWQTSHLQISQRHYLQDPDVNYVITAPTPIVTALSDNSAVKGFSSRVLVDGMVASARASRGVKIVGVDPEAEAVISPIDSHMSDGSWLTQDGRKPIVVSEKTASRLKLVLGSKVVLTFTNTNKDVTGAAFRVQGIFASPSSEFDESHVYVRDEDLRAATGVQGIHQIAVLLNSADNFERSQVEQIKAALQAVSDPADEVRDWPQIQPLLATLIGQMATSNAVVLVVFVSAMGFGIINIMLMAVFERTREFGVLMAVGMEKGQVFALIVSESALLGAVGALLGIVASSVLMAVLQSTGISLGNMAAGLGAFGVDTMLYPQVSLATYQWVFVAVMVVSVLAAMYPARQILKQRPVQAMSEKH